MAKKRLYKTDVLNCRISPELKAFIESIVEVENITLSEWVVQAYKDALKKYSDQIAYDHKMKFTKLQHIYSEKRASLIKKGKILPGQKPRYLDDERVQIEKTQLRDDMLLTQCEQTDNLTFSIGLKISQKDYTSLRELAEKSDQTLSGYLRGIIKKELS
jgi:hypothetical protein